MPVIVHSQYKLEKTKEYRLSIQVDLNGFSFSIINDSKKEVLYLYASDFPTLQGESELFAKESAKIIERQPLFKKKYKSASLIYTTEKYSILPKKLYKKGDELSELSKLHTLDDMEEINSLEVPENNMVILYAVNSTLLNIVKRYHQDLSIIPSIYTYIKMLPELDGYNKLSFHFIPEIVTIVAAEGKNIVYCNSFPAKHFNSAIYFVLLALKQVQFNPVQTIVYISGNIKDYEVFDITKYFSKINYFRNKNIPLGDPAAEMKYAPLLFKL